MNLVINPDTNAEVGCSLFLRYSDKITSLNGELTFEATEGVIKKSPLLNSIVLSMQLPVSILFAPEVSLVDRLLETEKKKGHNLLETPVQFKKINSTFHLVDGIAHTEDSHFEGKTVDLFHPYPLPPFSG
jgi:hypothetical protein